VYTSITIIEYVCFSFPSCTKQGRAAEVVARGDDLAFGAALGDDEVGRLAELTPRSTVWNLGNSIDVGHAIPRLGPAQVAE